jgi:ribosomal-protein-alanine N-acetyltransferase
VATQSPKAALPNSGNMNTAGSPEHSPDMSSGSPCQSMGCLVRPFFLSSERIGFGTWLSDDLPLATSLWGDPEVTRFHGGPWSLRQIEARLSLEIAMHETWGVQYWPLFLVGTGEHIGCCGFHVRDQENRVWELGCHLKHAFWSKRLGREAATAVIDHGFRALGFEAIFAGHHPLNTASRNFLQHLGFRYTHEEFYPATQLIEPCYIFNRPDVSKRDSGHW